MPAKGTEFETPTFGRVPNSESRFAQETSDSPRPAIVSSEAQVYPDPMRACQRRRRPFLGRRIPGKTR